MTESAGHHLDDDTTELRERLRRLEAAEVARDHLHAYARVLDEPHPDTVTALFAADAVLNTPSRQARGTAEIREFFEWAFAADPSNKRHFVANARTTRLDESGVRVQAQFLFTARGSGRSGIGWGRYDAVVNVAGPTPLFTEMSMAVEVSTDLVAGWQQEPQAR
ncbi:nuclear transport factor 2 family protein [Nocardia vermiculata]|uniref:SnoaL-like domain-containing protein n=1 Tax=Nocardia vermiculata TaxID=257274 RepID=A0A846Y1T9_9NOCA|nr:nuclear transport factor 2 family protein [Nocardia vermiculata]NKY51661.1 SnoaL-like domain-containing protein [Nocardia vermiculata]